MNEPLVERDFLEKLERLALRWEKSFNGLVGGRSPSRFAGAGQEFLDHRNFHTGDDLRAVNWRAYMRFERFFLKTFQIEPRVPVRLLIDVSTSMGVNSDTLAMSKFEYARILTAALIYIGLVRLDSIVVQPFSNALHQPFLASGGRHKFQLSEAFLRELTSEGTTNFKALAGEFIHEYPQRGLTIVISDFFESQAAPRAMQHLADFGHELLLVQVWTPEDREPSGTGELELVDAETGQVRIISLDNAVRMSYTEQFDAYREELQRLALRNRGRYTGLSTNQPIDEALFGPVALAVSA